MPAITSARDAARKISCSNNIRQLGLAIMEYEQTFKMYPPAYTVDANGNRLHSWRTIVLPFIDQGSLYNQIDFSKPWDDPVNQRFHDMMPEVYRCPSSQSTNTTPYQALVGPECIFTGSERTFLRDVTDGLANTILLVEAGNSAEVPWMSPDDIGPQEFLSLISSADGASQHMGGTHVVTSDVSVKFIGNQISPEILQSFMTKAGNEAEPAGLME